MSHHHGPEPIVDNRRSVCLTHSRDCCGCRDTCLPAYTAVHSDGRISLWLRTPGDEQPLTATPAHERTGVLPEHIAARIHPPEPPRRRICGHPTQTGYPCQRPVHAAGTACHQHAPRRTST